MTTILITAKLRARNFFRNLLDRILDGLLEWAFEQPAVQRRFGDVVDTIIHHHVRNGQLVDERQAEKLASDAASEEVSNAMDEWERNFSVDMDNVRGLEDKFDDIAEEIGNVGSVKARDVEDLEEVVKEHVKSMTFTVSVED